MESAWSVVISVAAYTALLALISFIVGRSAKTAAGFTSGGKVFPAILIGFLLASEFIGTSASIDTAQEAYSVGISAAWNIASLGIGFVLFAFLLRTATSVVMISSGTVVRAQSAITRAAS